MKEAKFRTCLSHTTDMTLGRAHGSSDLQGHAASRRCLLVRAAAANYEALDLEFRPPASNFRDLGTDYSYGLPELLDQHWTGRWGSLVCPNARHHKPQITLAILDGTVPIRIIVTRTMYTLLSLVLLVKWRRKDGGQALQSFSKDDLE